MEVKGVVLFKCIYLFSNARIALSQPKLQSSSTTLINKQERLIVH